MHDVTIIATPTGKEGADQFLLVGTDLTTGNSVRWPLAASNDAEASVKGRRLLSAIQASKGNK